MTRPVNRGRSRTAKSSADARFVALVKRANRAHGGGGICHACKRPLQSGEPTLVGRDRAGTALVVAVRCCRGRLRSLLGCGLFLAARDLPGPWLADVQPWGSA
jgi:hypothetical protein